jgi:uncharacterized protein YkwD
LVAASLFVAVEAYTLAVTWEDCGAKHAKVTDLQPTSIQTGTTETLTGTGTVDEDVTSAHFSATVKAWFGRIASCDGDGTTDIECKLPFGAGVITVKAVSYPLAKGTVEIPVTVKTGARIPASLAKVDIHIKATEQNGESVICMDAHTAKQGLIAPSPNTTAEVDVEAQADACLEKVNQYRAGKGRPALTLKSGQMSCAAQQSANDGPNLKWHGSFGQCSEMGQCQAAGQSTCSAAIDAYYSEGPGGGHYEIIMDSKYKSMAYGHCACSKYSHFWTHNFYISSSIDVQV